MVAPCHEYNDVPERAAETEFSPELSVSGVHGGVELCAVNSSLRTLVERWGSTQTVAIASAIQTHQPILNNKSRAS